MQRSQACDGRAAGMQVSFSADAWAGVTSMAFLLKVAGLAAFAIGIPCWRYLTHQRTAREDQEVRRHPGPVGAQAYADLVPWQDRLILRQPPPRPRCDPSLMQSRHVIIRSHADQAAMPSRKTSHRTQGSTASRTARPCRAGTGRPSSGRCSRAARMPGTRMFRSLRTRSRTRSATRWRRRGMGSPAHQAQLILLLDYPPSKRALAERL